MLNFNNLSINTQSNHSNPISFGKNRGLYYRDDWNAKIRIEDKGDHYERPDNHWTHAKNEVTRYNNNDGDEVVFSNPRGWEPPKEDEEKKKSRWAW